jgi:hypothetical protein
MVVQIHFKDFEADEQLKSAANAALTRVVDRSPWGSSAVALLEKQEEGYRCSIDIYSRSGPFMASTVRPTALETLRATEEKIKKQIDWCRSRRGPPTECVQRSMPTTQNGNMPTTENGMMPTT